MTDDASSIDKMSISFSMRIQLLYNKKISRIASQFGGMFETTFEFYGNSNLLFSHITQRKYSKTHFENAY